METSPQRFQRVIVPQDFLERPELHESQSCVSAPRRDPIPAEDAAARKLGFERRIEVTQSVPDELVERVVLDPIRESAKLGAASHLRE